MLADLASCSPRRAIAVPASSAPLSRLLCSSSPLSCCLHARLLSIVGQISDVSIRLSASTTAQSDIGFTSCLTISTFAQFGLPSSCVLADLASCSSRRVIAVPASSAPISPVSFAWLLPCLLSSCSLTADRWPNFRCLYPPFSLHYCSVCYQFHILVDNFDPCSIRPPLLLCAS